MKPSNAIIQTNAKRGMRAAVINHTMEGKEGMIMRIHLGFSLTKEGGWSVKEVICQGLTMKIMRKGHGDNLTIM